MDFDAPPRAGLPSHESAKEAAAPPAAALFDVAGVLANDGSGTILLDLLPKSAPAKGRTWRAARTRRSLAQAGDRAAGAPSRRGAGAPIDAEDGAAGVSRMLVSTYLGGAAPEEPRPRFEDFDEPAGAAVDFYDDGGAAAPPPERAPAAAPAAVQETSDIHNDALARFGIKTGDDAINFFSSQSGSQSSIKFVHLMQVDAVPDAFLQLGDGEMRPSSTSFRPYDLLAVRVPGATLARTRCDYFTMSSEGLVHMEPGHPSEFIPLTQWMRDAACFNMLTSIPYFRNYLRNKCFNAWRSNGGKGDDVDVVSRVIQQMEDLEKPKSMAALREQEALVELLIKTWAGFLAELLRPRRQSGLLETTIRFSEEGSAFSPARGAIQTVLANTADSLIATLGGVMRILYLRPLAKYIPSSSTPKSSPNVQEIVRNNGDFKATCFAINAKVESDFKKAQEYVDAAFDKVWPIYEYSRRWDFDAYKRQAHTVASLKKEMEKVASWEKELEKMRTRQTCGMLEVESRKLRQTLIPMTTEKMEALKDLVKDLSRAKCKDQRNKYKSAVSKITPRPMHLNGFTVLLERVDEQRVQARSLFKHTQIVDELRSIQAKYAEELEACQAFRDERLAEMTLQLEANVGKFAEQVAHITADLDAGLFIDVANFDMPETVLQELEAVRAKLENLIQSDLLHKKQQKLFGVAETRDKALEKTQEAFDRVRTLWTMVERWDEDYHSWIRDDFLSQNANSVDRDVKLYGARAEVAACLEDIVDKIEGRGSRDNSDDDDDYDDDDDDDEDYDDDDEEEEATTTTAAAAAAAARRGRASVRKSVRKSVRTTGRQHGTARAKKSAGN
ncbi:hypothetical protein JL720_2462 [Aureococcus anophagefferens]|nr:hypothetical protein JL720_2462 [Aureococcus anophagefferens]